MDRDIQDDTVHDIEVVERDAQGRIVSVRTPLGFLIDARQYSELERRVAICISSATGAIPLYVAHLPKAATIVQAVRGAGQ